MKFLLRLLHVFIGVLIFLGLGYLIQNVDFDSFVTDTVEETASDTNSDSSSHGEMTDDTSTTETDEHNTADSHDTAMNGNDDSEGHGDSDNHSSDEMDSDHTNDDNHDSTTDESADDNQHSSSVDDNAGTGSHDDSSMLSYEMDAIDPHSVGHITEMIEIIDAYRLEPHSDMKTLNNQLILRNYVHFEKELSKKNEPVFNALSDLFSQLDSTDSNDHNQIIRLLDDIQTILVKLEEVN